MSNQKLILLLIVCALVIIGGIFFMMKKIPQTMIAGTAVSPLSSQSPMPTPTPTPLISITSSSNLSEEVNKLKVPEFEEDYKKLDQTLNGF